MAKNFTIISGEDWAQTVEVKDDATNGPLTDIDTALIELQVQDDCGNVVLSASSDDTITKPETGHFTWRFTAAQTANLQVGKQYKVGCRMALDGATTMLFLSTLVIQESGFKWK